MDSIKEIVSANSAFAILTNNGCVYAWGDNGCGGDIGTFKDELSCNICQISSYLFDFLAISNEGQLYAWGCCGFNKSADLFPLNIDIIVDTYIDEEWNDSDEVLEILETLKN